MTLGQKIIVAVALVLVVIQGTIIFRDAMKKDIPYPWIWGIIGMMNIPSSAIIYLIFRRIYFKKKIKK